MASNNLSASVTLASSIVAIGYCVANRRNLSMQPLKGKDGGAKKSPSMDACAEHNLQRKAAIVKGGAADHIGSVIVVPDEDFDLDLTIFKALSGTVPRLNQKTKLGMKQFWSEEATLQIQQAFHGVPAAPKHDAAILNFMLDECDFCCEHADGSFMDHLNFCHDYSAVHFKSHSPRVLFLHSIMGVGTNVFPMSIDKAPQLRSMLTDFEYEHVEAFPSILRLMLAGSFTKDLAQNAHRISTLERISFHRVLDNEPLAMDAENLWIQLNYQLMHLLDFLPVACWGVNWDEPVMQVYLELFALLKLLGQVRANVVETAVNPERRLDGQPNRWVDAAVRLAPSGLKRRLAVKSTQNFSHAIGHDLGYELVFKAC